MYLLRPLVLIQPKAPMEADVSVFAFGLNFISNPKKVPNADIIAGV